MRNEVGAPRSQRRDSDGSAVARSAASAYLPDMDILINIAIALALLAVLVTLFAGIFAMVRGGEFNARHGNRLMRWRVTLQAVAIGVLLLGFWYKSQH